MSVNTASPNDWPTAELIDVVKDEYNSGVVTGALLYELMNRLEATEEEIERLEDERDNLMMEHDGAFES